MKSKSIRTMIEIALFAAILAILSQISIPLPSGVPITLQTFAVALTGYFLGAKRGIISVGVFLALGAVGLPVFSNFSGGVAKLVGVTGGFLWGFLPLAFCCGIAVTFFREKRLSILFTIGMSLIGLATCHFFGVLQFVVVTGATPASAFFTVSLPYLLKDAISLAAAAALAQVIRLRLRRPKI